jgi:adenylate cyclase
VNTYTGNPDVAVEHFQRALRLSPVDPLTFNIYIGIGLAHFEQQDYERP